jgi:hypothetical protein
MRDIDFDQTDFDPEVETYIFSVLEKEKQNGFDYVFKNAELVALGMIEVIGEDVVQELDELVEFVLRWQRQHKPRMLH